MMARPRTVIGEFARKLCQQYQNTPSLQLARMLYAEFPNHFNNVEAARSVVRHFRGGTGNKNKNPVPFFKLGPVKLPDHSIEPWVPVDIDWPARVLAISDVHIPYHIPRAVEAALAIGRKRKADHVLINGDFADFYSASHWLRDPRRRFVVDEVGPIHDGLRYVRSKFRKARIIYKFGNHEERLEKYVMQHCAEMWGLEALQTHNVLKLDELGIERVDDEPVMLGKLPALHGHELPKGISNPVSAARGAFLRTSHSVIVSHHHTTGTYVPVNMFGEELACFSIACLCDLHPQYSRFAKWNWGFAFIEIDKTGNYNVTNYRIGADFSVRTA